MSNICKNRNKKKFSFICNQHPFWSKWFRLNSVYVFGHGHPDKNLTRRLQCIGVSSLLVSTYSAIEFEGLLTRSALGGSLQLRVRGVDQSRGETQ